MTHQGCTQSLGSIYKFIQLFKDFFFVTVEQVCTNRISRNIKTNGCLNAELQFEHSNVQLLTGNMNDGVEAYKRYHRIKDDSLNYKISQPYKKTNELIGQIQNLREEPSGQGIRERRISQHIQRDSWSALKYALRFAQILERTNLQTRKNKSDWDRILENYRGKIAPSGAGSAGGRSNIARHRGKIF